MFETLNLSYFSQGFVINMLLSLMVALFLLSDTRKRRANKTLALFFFGNAALSAGYLWGTVDYSETGKNYILLSILFLSGLTSLLWYVYHFPGRLKTKEKPFVFFLSFLSYAAVVHEMRIITAKYSFDLHTYLYPMPVTSIIVALHLIWASHISIRQILPRNSYRAMLRLIQHRGLGKTISRFQRSTKDSGFALSLAPVLALSALIPLLHLANALGYLQNTVYFVLYQNFFALINILFVYLMFTYGKRSTGYLVKTTGFTVMTVVIASQVMSYLSLNQVSRAYDRERERELPYIVDNLRNDNLSGIPMDVSYIFYSDENQNLNLFVRNQSLRSEFAGFVAAPENMHARFRKIGSEFFAFYRHSVAGNFYEIGYPYESFRKTYHESIFYLTVMTLGITFFALALFPMFIRKGVIVPIRRVTEAFQKIRSGYLSHSLPVRHHDEIGLMTAGFNRMAKTLRTVETRIRNYTENLEDMVDARSSEIKEKVKLLESLNQELGKEISEKNSIAEDLRNSKRFLSEIASASPQILFLYDLDHAVLVYSNRATEAVQIHSSFPDCLGHEVYPDDSEKVKTWLQQVSLMNEDLVKEIEYRVKLPGGRVIWVDTRISVFTRRADGFPSQIIGTSVDITEKKLAQEKVLYLAHHDSLTSLPNRMRLAALFDEMIQANPGRPLALLFLDLDRFKWVNDNMGHESGDLLLMSLAIQLRRQLEPGDILARWGGDEFVLLLHESGEIYERARDTAESILLNLREPFLLAGREVFISGTIGIAVYPDHGDKLSKIMRKADMAMFAAKAEGRDRVRFYDDEIAGNSEGKLDMERELRYAIENNAFIVRYQPKVDMKSRQIVGVEALVRWNKNGEDLVAPDQFIPIAEETGLIIEISRLVFNEAFAQAAEWKRKGIHLPVSVNVSNRQLHETDLGATIMKMLEQHGIDIDDIELELTESIILDQSPVVLQNLHDLRKYGFTLSLDDFGTGYSSINSLRSLPISKLKIDKSFVNDLNNGDKESEQLISAIVAFARQLNLKLVAEGVETEGQLLFLEKEGVHEAQGFYFGKAMHPQQIENLFDDNNIVSELS